MDSVNTYDGKYIKLVDSYQFWAVDNGERTPVHTVAQMHEIGIRYVEAVSEKELEAVPIAGKKPTKKTRGKK